MDETSKCEAIVYIRDTYRYTGRGKNGLELHYKRCRCKRDAQPNGYCWQHQDKREDKHERVI